MVSRVHLLLLIGSCCVAAAQPRSGAGAVAPEEEEEEEALALVQASALLEADHGPEKKRRTMLDRVDCQQHPALCKAPFDCGGWNNKLRVPAFALFGVGSSGHANLHSWCTAPQYERYVKTCLVEKDLVKAALWQYKATEAGMFGDGVAAMDGSYCFLEGHCTNTAVSNSTTLEEAEEMCDYRYGGRQGWTSFGQMNPSNFQQFRHIMMGRDHNNDAKIKGFRDRGITQYYARSSRRGAMRRGRNFHCDVVYCKETYCKEPRYVERFRHLLPSLPGHLIQDAKQEEPPPINGF